MEDRVLHHTWHDINKTSDSAHTGIVLLYVFDDKNYVSDVTETIVVDCCVWYFSYGDTDRIDGM